MPDRKQVQKDIERAQQDGVAKLGELVQQGQLTDTEYYAASQRVVSLCTRTLRLLDEAWLEVAEYVEQEGRNSQHQAWIAERATFLLQSLERAIADITASALSQVRQDLPNTRPREKVVREVIVAPPRRQWPEWLVSMAKFFRGLVAFAGFALFLGLLFRNGWVAIFVPIATFWLFDHFIGRVIVPGVVALLVWVFLVVL